jgi:hypothetical protein
MTEDVAMQQQSLFVALGGSAESSRIRQTLQLASLVSDMSAFKVWSPHPTPPPRHPHTRKSRAPHAPMTRTVHQPLPCHHPP